MKKQYRQLMESLTHGLTGAFLALALLAAPALAQDQGKRNDPPPKETDRGVREKDKNDKGKSSENNDRGNNNNREGNEKKKP
ncbi:MAG: hypothetical protein ACKV2V_24225 [Blastocatellia bacterium]